MGEALALSLAFHAVILAALLLRFTQVLAVAPPPQRHEPVVFRFVDQPQTPTPDRPPPEDAPSSDRDRAARSPEPRTEAERQGSRGASASLAVPSRPPAPSRPEPPRPRPPEPEPREPSPRIPRPEPAEPREERPTVEERRRTVLERLAELEKGDLFEQPPEVPEGDFFGEPSSDISFETQGVDWGPYAARLHRIVKRNWIIPPAAQIGQKGVVKLRFDIGADGSVQNLEVLTPSGTVALDDSAWAAIANSHPLPPPPLPDDWHKDSVGVRWTFYYNTRPR